MSKPVLYIPIGLPGSGKSSFFSKIKGKTTVSSDGIRKELFKDENIQYTDEFLKAHGYSPEAMHDEEKRRAANSLIFEEVQRRVEILLREGKDAVYDGVNIERYYRSQIIRKFSPLACLHGVYFNVPVEFCIERDQKRTSHNVGEKRIRRMEKQFDRPKIEEGYDILETVDAFGNRISIQYRED